MYEQQKPFKLTDIVKLSGFLNQFLYKIIMGNIFGKFKILLEVSMKI